MAVGKYVAPEHVPAHLLPTSVEGENLGVRPWATLAGTGREGHLLLNRLEGGDVSVLGLDPGRNMGAPCPPPIVDLPFFNIFYPGPIPRIYPKGPLEQYSRPHIQHQIG